MKLSIVIPVRNEADTIVTLVERVRAVDYGMSREIIVVDGASTDGTREALLSLPTCSEIVLVLEDQARGKGRAVRTGFERATGDILVVQDADLELDPAQIPFLLQRLMEEERTAVFGSRFKDRGRGDTPLVSYTGNKILTWSANLLFFTRLTDILTCYKVLRSDVARALNLRCDGFDFDAEVPCRLLRQGYQIVEVPVTYNPRSIDEGKKLTARAGWSVLRAILHIRFTRSPVGVAHTTPARSQ
jgi:glycosyltransferase involved in cell wall biosynthesis